MRDKQFLEKKFQSIEPFIVDPKRNAFCIQCGNLATKLVKYGTEGAIILEKYCDKCARRIESNPVKWFISDKGTKSFMCLKCH